MNVGELKLLMQQAEELDMRLHLTKGKSDSDIDAMKNLRIIKKTFNQEGLYLALDNGVAMIALIPSEVL